MTRSTLVLMFLAFTTVVPSATAQSNQPPVVPLKVLQADTVYIDCSVCPRRLAVANQTAHQELLEWGRFRLQPDLKRADLIFMFSTNPYQGDYTTRDGPDKRPVYIDFTIMTIIDPHTGENLWTDWRRYGSFRVAAATRELIAELRSQMAEKIKRWTLDEILECAVTPAYRDFASLTPEQALSKSALDVERVADTPDRLAVDSPDAPEFCRKARLVVGPDNKITSLEVDVSQAETMDVADVLERADQFDFVSEKNTQSKDVSFSARSKDKGVLIQFSMEGHRTVFSRVLYSY
jgi:hypothetical protein